MSWLDKFFGVGIIYVQVGGAVLPVEQAINFASGAAAVDNPQHQRTDIRIVGGGQGGWNVQPVYTAAGTLNVPVPGAGYAGTSQPFSNATNTGAAVVFPAPPSPGMLFKFTHTSGDALNNPIPMSAADKIQDPQNMTVTDTTYSWTMTGASVTWEYVSGDPINGNYWAAT